MIKDTESGATHFADDATLAYIVKLETELAALKATSAEPVAWLVSWSDNLRGRGRLLDWVPSKCTKENGFTVLNVNTPLYVASPEAQLKAAQREVLEKALWQYEEAEKLGVADNPVAGLRRMIDEL